MINNNNTPNPGGLLAAQMWLQTYTSSKLQQEHIKQLSIFKTKANWTDISILTLYSRISYQHKDKL